MHLSQHPLSLVLLLLPVELQKYHESAVPCNPPRLDFYKMTPECNKYAFSTLFEVVIRDLQVVIRDLQRKNVWIIRFQTNGTFSVDRRITVYLEPPILPPRFHRIG
jgi:hypothetical protein